MSSPSYQQLAKAFVDLWQKQLTSVMNDRDFIQSMLDTLNALPADFTASYETFSQAANPAAGPERKPDRMAELDYRLRMCEERLARLEQAAGIAERHRVGGESPAG